MITELKPNCRIASQQWICLGKALTPFLLGGSGGGGVDEPFSDHTGRSR